MTLMLTIKSGCTVCITIPIIATVKTLIVHCSSWTNVPTLSYKMQLAPILSRYCNIQHHTQQQGQHKLQWSMFWKEQFTNFSSQIQHIDKVFHTTTSWNEWRHESLGGRKSRITRSIEQLAIQDEDSSGDTTRNALFKQRRDRHMDQGLCWLRTHCGKKASWRRRDSD